MSDTVAIVLAAGAGERIGDAQPKAFLELAGTPILAFAVTAAAACPSVDSIVVAVPEGWEERARAALGRSSPITVVSGGATRHASVRSALAAVDGDALEILCHDAARPFASPDLFSAVLEGLADADGAVPIVPIPDTVKRVRDGLVAGTEPRDELGLAQTPQAFVSEALREAHARAEAAGLDFTDDAAVLEWAGYRIRAVPGEPGNLKITSLDDLAMAEGIVARARRG